MEFTIESFGYLIISSRLIGIVEREEIVRFQKPSIHFVSEQLTIVMG